jgi:putative SOS response-associated peptidase YedK
MCNLYSMTTTKETMRQFAFDDRGVKMPALPGIYPDYSAPIIRNNAALREAAHASTARELAMGRWGMPTPPTHLIGKRVDSGITNIRNTRSAHWRRWLDVESSGCSAACSPMVVSAGTIPKSPSGD